MEDLSRPAPALTRDLDATKPYVDKALSAYLTSKVSQAKDIDPAYGELWQSIQTLVLSGGKRLRPFILLSIFSAYTSDNTDDILPAALSAELIHQAMLIHDDIIDRDDTRYGTKNISGSYLDHYAHLVTDPSERRHYATSSALLAGDLLISDAFQLLQEITAAKDTIDRLQEQLNAAIFGVVAGEFLDTEAAFKKLAGAHPQTIALYKTASYSFIMPLTMGAILSGAPQQDQKLLRQFGELLGIAYQMRDDILGSYGDSTVTGKSSEGDIREGKRTFLTDEFLRRASDEQKQQFHQAYGVTHASTDAIEVCRQVLKASGAVDAVEAEILSYADQAAAIIAQLTISDRDKANLRHLTDICLRRDK